jgi:glucose-6-phosphate isomerase
MSAKPIPLLSYDVSGTVGSGLQLLESDLHAMYARLDGARREVLTTDLELFHGDPAKIPLEKRPLDAGFYELPEIILAEYRQQRQASELGRIMATAARLRDTVDNVVILGIGGSYMGARALFDACCHPYHNDLTRAERGGVPRIYFDGNNVDNDATQGLLDVLRRTGKSSGIGDRWAMIVISKSGGTLETAAAFRTYLKLLSETCGGDAKEVAKLVVPVTGLDDKSKLYKLARAIGCPQDETFEVPDGVGGRFSVLSAVGLLPAAVMGLDVLRLLEGAAAMNEHFRTASPAGNIVLRYVAVGAQLESGYKVHTRILSTWAKSLESVGLWYDQLLAESLGKHELGALPLTVVNTRDLHSRGQQHQEGRRDKLITNLIIDGWRRDPLAIGHSELNEDGLNELAHKTLPDIMSAAIAGTNLAYRDARRPTTDLHLPAADEASLGQFFQMMMLATVVEGRYLAINPYGQPGVEAYKRNMNAILRGKLARE